MPLTFSSQAKLLGIVENVALLPRLLDAIHHQLGKIVLCRWDKGSFHENAPSSGYGLHSAHGFFARLNRLFPRAVVD